jgi:tetratricopeptide (TPR) repeat protein
LDPRRAFDELLTITRQHLPGRAVADRFLQVAAHAEENPPLGVIAAGMNEPVGGLAWTGEDLREQAVALARWQLLNWNGLIGVVSLHPVIKQYFLALVPPEESLAIHRRLADWYDHQTLPPAAISLDQVRCRVLAVIHFWRCGEISRAQNLMFKPVIGNQPFIDWLTTWGHQHKGVELLTPLIEATVGFERAALLTSRGGLRRQALQEQAAANDLDEAIALLSVGLENAGAVQLLDLAGAYMNRGNVARDLGRYTDATYYAKALDALEGIRDLRFLFAKSLETVRARLNRANYLCDLGELSAALQDCDAAARLCRDLIDDGLTDQTPMLAAVLESQGIVLADLHRWEEALSCFASSLELCQGLLGSGVSEMAPRIAHLRSMTAVTLTDLRRFPEAIQALNDAIAAFQPLIDSGRADLEWQLALAFLNRSLAHLGCGHYLESIEDGERAAAMFARLARKEARLEGWLGHVLTILAEARFFQGDPDGSRADRLRGLQVLAGFLGKGDGGHGVFLRRSVQTAIYLFAADPAEAERILAEAVSVVERALEWKLGAEALRLEASSALSRLAPLRDGSNSRSLDRELLLRLSQAIAQGVDAS